MNTEDTHVMPPQDQEAEVAVLGSMLLDHEAVAEAADTLTTTDFYSPQHQQLFAVLQDLYKRKVPIDLVMVQGVLADGGLLEEVGGMPYLGRLHEAGLPAMQTHYLERVLTKSQQRQLLQLSQTVAKLARTDPPQETCEKVARELARIQRVAHDEFIPMRDMLGAMIEELEGQLSTDDHTWGIPTKIERLDALISGWTPATYNVIAARPRVGKTAFAWEQCWQAAEAGKRVAFFSMEMREGALGRRWLANTLEIELSKIMSAHFARDRMEDVIRVSAAASRWPLWVCPRADLTIGELRAQARRLAGANGGLDLIAVDYIQLMKAGYRCGSRNEEVGEVSRGLKALAQELSCPLLVLSQLNRAAEVDARFPRLSDLRDSGTIEQDADIVLFIVWPGWDKEWLGTTPEQQAEAKGKRVLHVAKQRNGDTGKIEVAWSGAYQRFAALETDREESRPFWMND